MLRDKRPKPRQQMSPLQRKRVLRISAVLVVIAVLVVFFAPGSGLLALWKKHKELRKLEEKSVQLERENDALRKEIERVQHDSRYLEEVARKDYGLLRRNEKVFDFSREKATKED